MNDKGRGTKDDWIEEMAEEIIGLLRRSPTKARARLNGFIRAFNVRFPPQDAEERGSAEALTWALMDGPLTLYAIGLNGPAIVELHSIVERLALRETARHLAVPKRRSLLMKILRRYTLPDLTALLCEVGVLDKEDLKLAKKLNALRNGIAHKNERLVSNLLASGRRISYLDIDRQIAKLDCIPLITQSTKFLTKMAKITVKVSIS